ILEIGSGIGNISKCFIDAGKNISLSDIRENYLQHLKNNYGKSPSVKSIFNLDLVHPDFKNKYADVLNSYDGIFALNVIEHIKDDELALHNSFSLLKQGGTLLILVPANAWMYNGLDKDLHHYRRYSLKELKRKIVGTGLQTQSAFFFNALGSAGWIFSGLIMKRKIISAGQMSAFNMMVPVARIIDKVLQRHFGLSVIIVAKKM
ncbi:MAG: methyltransferase domain-containing protein, partial [Bacteroidota bacterium]